MRRKGTRSATVVVVLATAVGGSIGGCRSASTSSASTSSASSEGGAPLAVASGQGPGVIASPSSSFARLPAVRNVEDAGPLSSAIPVPEAHIADSINPGHLEPYAGPTGVVEGVVKISGDTAPKRDLDLPFACGEAAGTYGKIFREGLGRTLADAMVAVTGYHAFVPPPPGNVVAVRIHGCAFDQRTLAFSYGKRIEVTNTDPREAFVPQLVGAHSPAVSVAIPRGEAVKLYPTEPGHYALADGMKRSWMYADVFVLNYSTVAVTGLDGKFRVSGIPVGKVKVTAYLPAIDKEIHFDVGIADPTVEREVEIKAGETAHLDFVIAYKTPKAQKPPVKPVPLAPDIR